VTAAKWVSNKAGRFAQVNVELVVDVGLVMPTSTLSEIQDAVYGATPPEIVRVAELDVVPDVAETFAENKAGDTERVIGVDPAAARTGARIILRNPDADDDPAVGGLVYKRPNGPSSEGSVG